MSVEPTPEDCVILLHAIRSRLLSAGWSVAAQ